MEWDEGILTLAIHEDEKDGHLVVVYDNGEVIRVPMSKVLRMPMNVRHKMLTGRRPVFVSPARKNDAILTVYYDKSGKRYLRLDDLTAIEEGKLTTKGSKLTDVEFDSFKCCEIIEGSSHKELKRLYNLKRTSLGFQASNAYGKEELKELDKLGIKY